MHPVFATSGWRRHGLAALLGVLAAAALPPFYLLPLLVPAFSGLFLLTLQARNSRQAFAGGWWWGLGHFTAGLYWICIALYIEPDKFAWLTPFALFGLPSILAIYTGLVTLALYRIHKRWPKHAHALLVIHFSVLWLLAEYARGHLFTGFPWNLTGYVWNISDVTLQTASLWGVYGQGWLAVTLATFPALFLIKNARPLPFNIAGGTLLLAVIIFGFWRLAEHPTQYSSTHLRVVQANIPQTMKFDPKAAMEALRKHVDLTRRPNLEAANIVVWPETAVPFYLSADSPLAYDLGHILKGGTLLLTGGLRGEGGEKNWKAWNSVFVINAEGVITAQYDKHHLVPFGEYVPFRTVLPLDNIAGGHGDFSVGPGPSTLTPAGVPPLSPLICYEAIFPGEVASNTLRPEWLVNVTNDAWYGVSSGPFQHLEMARTRAVEEGLPLVRAANTGISVVTDAYGRVVSRLPLNETGIIDVALPQSIEEHSIFSRFAYIALLAITFATYCLTAVICHRFNIGNNLVD